MRIFHKIILGFLPVTLLIWGVGFVAVFTFRDVRVQTISSYTLSVADMILADLDSEVRENLERLAARSKGDRLQETVRESNEIFEAMPDPESEIDLRERVWMTAPEETITPFMQQILDLPLSRSFRAEQALYRQQHGYPLFGELFVTNRFGALAGTSNKTTDYRQNDEIWWKEAWEKGFFIDPPEFDPSSRTFSIPMAVRVENDRAEPVGVFKGAFDFLQMIRQLQKSQSGLPFKTGRLFLLDPEGRYLFPQEKFGQEVPPFLKSYLADPGACGESRLKVLNNEAGENRFFICKRFLKGDVRFSPGWTLVTAYDGGEIFEPNRRMEAAVFVVSLIATVLSGLVGFFMALSFSRPLEKLRRAAGRFGQGDFATKLEISSRDEFGALAEDFEAMAENVRNKTTSIENLDREIEERKLLEAVSQENALFLQKLMDAIPGPVFYKDISGIYIGCNRAFESFFGISRKDLIGKKANDLFLPEMAGFYQKKDEELFAQPGVQVYEALVKNAEGRSRDVVFQKATFEGPSGEVHGLIGVMMDITERKRAEESREEAQKFLNTAINSIADIFYVFDADEHILLWNEAFEKMTGYSSEEISRMRPTDFFDAPGAIRMTQAIRKTFEEGVNTIEENLLTKEGRKIPLFLSGSVAKDLSGKPILCGVGKDITERKRAEEALRESEKRFMDVLYSAHDAILLIDGETFVDCNEATAHMLGYSDRAKFLMKHPSELSPPVQPDGRNSFEKANDMMRLAFERGFNRFEWVHRKASGEDFPVEVSLTPVSVHGKNILHCLWRDLTESKQKEDQIRKLSRALEQSPSCALITDRDGRIEYVNQSFVDLTGYSREEALGQTPRILKSGEHFPEFYKGLWDTLLAGKDWQGQFCNRKKTGELYWELAHIAPLRDEKGEITHFVAMKEDITYRRQIEEQLRHSLRMEAVGRLAGGIAHDFNNMLTVINGYSGYLVGKMKPDDPHYDKIREIRDAGDCAATIVRQLLNLSRKEAPRPQPVKVADVTVKMKHIITRLLGEDVELKALHTAEAGYVVMDPGQMEQVFLNLLVNAREAMPGGGVLTLTTELVHMEEVQEELRPPLKRSGRFVRISVQDTGTGIDPALKGRIFEPFFTTKKRGMNTGLGLSIVYGIVEEAGGAISFESQVGKGTTFRVYLPQAQEIPAGGEAQVLEDLPPGQGKILLVEDETPVREFALQVLRERGYDVRAVRGGEEAVRMIAEDPGRRYDLLLTDLTMPKMNGKELVLRVRQIFPEIKVIFMSGYSEHTIAEIASVSFLQKPFSHRALAMKVWDVLGR